ncbi:MAG TPA: propionyl-CoA synthetase [Roseiarcus sp.]|nr:propionyl-CoA synthetase [Roseiarcus sp.]
MSGYRQTYDQWRADPQGFWAEAARQISWTKEPDRIFDPDAGVYGLWFPDARCNACYNAVDRHVEAGRADQPALYYDSPVTSTKRTLSYRDLLDETAALGAVLQDLGVGAGDRVLIYMPMIPEAVVAMLACARIGAVHSVVFGGFAAKELTTRIDDAEPKVILTASCGIEPGRVVEYKPLLDLAIALAKHKPATSVVYQRPQAAARMNAPRDLDWTERVAAAKAAGKRAACADLAATDPLYILYTSGTTGVPKGVVRDIGGYIVALKWSMSAIYGVNPGDVYWAASDIGWVVGHSYIVYGPLLHGCASVLYEGKPIGTPDAGTFWRVIQDYKVRAFFTAPTAFRAVRKEDPQAKLLENYDVSSMHTLFLAGERADPDTVAWAQNALRVPVVDHWWQTETGWAIAANPVGLGLLPIKLGSPTAPMPGYDVAVVDEASHPVPRGTMGSIVVKLPLPPGCLPTLYRQDERMRESYLKEFPGYYKTADAGYVDEDGYLYIMGRTDDIINVAGHRLSTGGMEEVIASHPDVAECAVVGVKDDIKGEAPCGFVVLKAGVNRPPEEIEQEVVKLVREKIGPVAAFKTAIVVARLPKTRSGKILRGTMKKIADRDAWSTPATIEDPKALDEIAAALGAGAG